MQYPHSQTPMTTNLDSYMEFRRTQMEERVNTNNSIDLQRRKTRLQETFEFIRRKFGRRRIITYKH